MVRDNGLLDSLLLLLVDRAHMVVAMAAAEYAQEATTEHKCRANRQRKPIQHSTEQSQWPRSRPHPGESFSRAQEF